jgi:predicted enzyme related to lactoylglutathione lyase
MNSERKARFGFTKLIVDDEEAMATYYSEVYGLKRLHHVDGGDPAVMGPIREVIMGPGDTMSAESLIMIKFLDKPAPRDREVILGFVTDDLDALGDRVIARGGKHLGTIRSMPEHGVRVLFTTDPEGRLSKNVEMIAS